MDRDDIQALIDQLLQAKASVEPAIRGLADYAKHEADPSVAAVSNAQRAKLLVWQQGIDAAVAGLRALLDTSWPEVPKTSVSGGTGAALDAENADILAARQMFVVIKPATRMEFKVLGNRDK